MNCLDVAVDPECMYNDQTDFVGGDLPQVTFFVIMTRMTFMIMIMSVPGMQLDMCVVFVRFSEGAVSRRTRNPRKSASKSVKSDRGASESGHHIIIAISIKINIITTIIIINIVSSNSDVVITIGINPLVNATNVKFFSQNIIFSSQILQVLDLCEGGESQLFSERRQS